MLRAFMCYFPGAPSDSALRYPEGGTKDRFAFREDQLLFRRLELYIAYAHFRNLTQFPGESTSGMLLTLAFILPIH